MRATILAHPSAHVQVRDCGEALALLRRDELAAADRDDAVRLAMAGRDREREAAMRDLAHDPEGLACLLRCFA